MMGPGNAGVCAAADSSKGDAGMGSAIAYRESQAMLPDSVQLAPRLAE